MLIAQTTWLPLQCTRVSTVALADMLHCGMQVLEKKKADLLAKYTSESLLSQQQQAKSLLNKR